MQSTSWLLAMTYNALLNEHMMHTKNVSMQLLNQLQGLCLMKNSNALVTKSTMQMLYYVTMLNNLKKCGSHGV